MDNNKRRDKKKKKERSTKWLFISLFPVYVIKKTRHI